MKNIDDLTVQATHIKNGLEGILDSLYNMSTEDLHKMNITIATLESIKCLSEKHADDLEQLSK